MPRTNRHFVPGLVSHITHRCHDFKRRIVKGRSGIERIERRDDRWSESIAVGGKGFAEQVKNDLVLDHTNRRVWWRTVYILFESRCCLIATISIGKMRL
jgi:hypothetical protein